MGLLEDAGEFVDSADDTLGDIPILGFEQTYTDPETGEQHTVTGGTLPFGPAVGGITKIPAAVRAGGAVAGDYLFNYGPVGQTAREYDVGPRDVGVDDIDVDLSDQMDELRDLAPDDPTDPGNYVPDWLPWATGGTLGLFALALLAYLFGQLFTFHAGGN